MIITSGSPRLWTASWDRSCLFCSSLNLARRGSSIEGKVLLLSPEYQGRLEVFPFGPSLTTRLSARVVLTPRWCIASLAKNSLIDERRTARPSAPRQKGVRPPPFNCNSYLALDGPSRASGETTTSPTLMARPSPYPSPVPNGQLCDCLVPMMLSAYGVAHVLVSMWPLSSCDSKAPFTSPEKNLANSSDVTSSSVRPSRSATSELYKTRRGFRSGVGATSTK
mmetsp:Transcript_43919/g.133778  ORF Transcript_43919/g.133778 Transcript_43919/m.133778 type:complete len:223 (-) Transcript_43919:607-1275(-)